MENRRVWWKEAVVYQIYPRSFCDSNSDGIGDINGIISKLDYIKNFGADIIWLCPVYKSPNDDNGYDISDYQCIMDEFGTLEDFDRLLEETHRRGLKLIMDLVVNHTSDEHRWFIESREGTGGKRNYYIWRKGRDRHEPNNWASFFTPSAWKYDESSGEYYLHLFSNKQPDLNWENERVRAEVHRLMTWWLDRGIDGFRMDVINCISKAEGLPPVPAAEGESPYDYKWAGRYFLNGPRIHEYLKEMNNKVLSGHDIVTVGETPEVTPEEALLYAGFDRRELNMVFQFDLMNMDSGLTKWEHKDWKLADIKRIISRWQTALDGKAWNSLFLDNHDQPRALSRFANDMEYRVESGKLLATLLLTLQGTPYIYQGDEIGMTNVKLSDISGYRDIESLTFYEQSLKNGMKPSDAMKAIYEKGRDNARTPMQWNDGPNAGFTAGTPWIAINPNYTSVNAAREAADPDSVYNHYKRLIELRKNTPALVYGSFAQVLEDDSRIFAYKRVLDSTELLVVLNFCDKDAAFELPQELYVGQCLISNYNIHTELKSGRLTFRPYEAATYKIKR